MKLVRLCLLCVPLCLAGTAWGQTRDEAQEALELLERVVERAYARSGANAGGDVVNFFTDEQCEAMIKNEGLEFEQLDRDEARSVYRVQLEEWTILLFNFRGSHDLQLYAGFRAADDEISQDKLEMVNDWNRTKRFAKAYIDDEGDWVLEYDYDTAAGVSKDAASAMLQLFTEQVESFVDFISE